MSKTVKTKRILLLLLLLFDTVIAGLHYTYYNVYVTYFGQESQIY